MILSEDEVRNIWIFSMDKRISCNALHRFQVFRYADTSSWLLLRAYHDRDVNGKKTSNSSQKLGRLRKEVCEHSQEVGITTSNYKGSIRGEEEVK